VNKLTALVARPATPPLGVPTRCLVWEKEVFSPNPHSTDMNESEMERLTVYALTTPKKLPEIGLYLERRVGKKFARKEYGHLQVRARWRQDAFNLQCSYGFW